MTLKDLIHKAFQERDAHAAGKVADFCRFRLGLNYAQTFEVVQDVVPLATLTGWESLLYEADLFGD